MTRKQNAKKQNEKEHDEGHRELFLWQWWLMANASRCAVRSKASLSPYYYCHRPALCFLVLSYFVDFGVISRISLETFLI